MKKSTKIILIAALALVVAGVIIAAVSIGNGAKVEVKREDGQRESVNEVINTIVDNSVRADGENVTVSSSGDYTGKRWNDFSADGIYEIPADGIDSIDIDWLAGGVEIKLTDGDKITLTESSKTELDEETALCWRIDGDELEIKYAARKDELPKKFLCVELPKTLAVKSAEVGSVSGYISIEGLRVEKKLDVSGNSGSVKLVDCTARVPHRVTVRPGEFEDLKDCDVIVNCVGKIELLCSTHDRVTEMDFTIPAVRSYADKIKASGFDGVLINITNPCDIVTRELALHLGLPKGRVGRLVACSAIRCWGEVRSIGLDHDAFERNVGTQYGGKLGLLKCNYASDT